jgi:uncharacterized membrane protein
MSDERYAPPTAPLTEPQSQRGTGRIDLGDAFREAWGGTWSNFGLLFLSGLTGFVVGALSAATLVGLVLIVPVLIWGSLRLLLNVLAGRGEVADLFSGFSDYGRVLAAMLVLLVLYLAVGLAGQSVSLLGRMTGSAVLGFAGALLNLFWSFGVMPRLAFASYYVVEHGLAPADALRTSWERTRDQKLICAVLALLSFLIPVVGFLFLVVGVIPGWMISALMHAAAYRQLEGNSGAA